MQNLNDSIKEAQRLLHKSIMEQYTIMINKLFSELKTEENLGVEVVSIDSLIDGAYIIFYPKNLDDFYLKFDSLKRVIKEGLSAELVESDLAEALIENKNLTDIENDKIKLFYIHFPKDIEDVEKFEYSKYRGIVNSIVIGKTIYGDTQIIEDIEQKIIIVNGVKNSGIKNFKNLLNEEISYKHKKVQIIDNYDLKNGIPTKKGIYFVEDITGNEELLRDSSVNNLIFIELQNKGLGYFYNKTSKVKIRTFFKN